MPRHTEDVRARVVAVRLLVRAHAKLADVRVHRAVRQRELDVATAAARAALFPLRQLEARQVRDKVRLPLVPTGFDSAELALPAEVPLLADAVLEGMPIFEDETDVVE